MSQVSKYPVHEKVSERIYELLLKVITDSCDKEEAKNLMEDLLTPTEKIMLGKRLTTAMLIIKGYSYREIGKIIRISPSTVTKMSIQLKYGENGGLKRFVDKILLEEKMISFWSTIEETILNTVSHGKGGASWRYLRDEARKERAEKRSVI